MNRRAEMLKKFCAKIISPLPRPTGDQHQIIRPSFGGRKNLNQRAQIIRPMKMIHDLDTRLATQPRNQRSIAVPNLPRFRHLLRRDNLIPVVRCKIRGRFETRIAVLPPRPAPPPPPHLRSSPAAKESPRPGHPRRAFAHWCRGPASRSGYAHPVTRRVLGG